MNYDEAYESLFHKPGYKAFVSFQILPLVAENNKAEAIKRIKRSTNCSDETADHLWNDLINKFGTPETNPFIHTEEEALINAHNNAIAREWQNKPKCPTCGSQRIKKISTTAKVAGAAMFGLLSKTAKSQFKCENCGYKW